MTVEPAGLAARIANEVTLGTAADARALANEVVAQAADLDRHMKTIHRRDRDIAVLADRLAAMTAARDEACVEWLARVTPNAACMGTEHAVVRIAELMKVGAE